MSWERIKDLIGITFVFIAVIAAFGGLLLKCSQNRTNDIRVIDENKIDSIIKENEVIILEVDSLEQIKDAKVLEVKTLDNDSTIKLFYELIRK